MLGRREPIVNNSQIRIASKQNRKISYPNNDHASFLRMKISNSENPDEKIDENHSVQSIIKEKKNEEMRSDPRSIRHANQEKFRKFKESRRSAGSQIRLNDAEL